jgi:2-(1,2-epoxy-1,2-dihydrophenyl)acetyl-CoA isomerase
VAGRLPLMETVYVTYSKISYDVVDQVAFIQLNDPETLNAMSLEMACELLDAVKRAQGEARAILLGAVGRAFCSGAFLSDTDGHLNDPDRDVGVALETTLNPLILEMRSSPLPIVSALRGAVVGIGCGIALAADLIIAGESAFIYQAFRHVGLTPDGGSTYLLAKAIGRVRAMEVMLLGEKLKAPKALEWGLINRVVPDHEVDQAGLELAGQLARGPRSLGMIKASAWAALESPLEEQLGRERTFQREACRTDDFIEGVQAFLEKRPPSFSGR